MSVWLATGGFVLLVDLGGVGSNSVGVAGGAGELKAYVKLCFKKVNLTSVGSLSFTRLENERTDPSGFSSCLLVAKTSSRPMGPDQVTRMEL